MFGIIRIPRDLIAPRDRFATTFAPIKKKISQLNCLQWGESKRAVKINPLHLSKHSVVKVQIETIWARYIDF